MREIDWLCKLSNAVAISLLPKRETLADELKKRGGGIISCGKGMTILAGEESSIPKNLRGGFIPVDDCSEQKICDLSDSLGKIGKESS
jgi:hypothetical protein